MPQNSHCFLQRGACLLPDAGEPSPDAKEETLGVENTEVRGARPDAKSHETRDRLCVGEDAKNIKASVPLRLLRVRL